MIIVEIIGGLGNQMFQYALGRYLTEKNNAVLKLDITGFDEYNLRKYELGVFNIEEDFATAVEIDNIKFIQSNCIKSFIRKIKGKKDKKLSQNFIKEKYFHFDSNILNLPDDIYLQGYWQSEKYFNEISDILREEFTLKNEIEGKNKEFFEKIKSTNSVSLHIRRGDYASDPKTKAVHGVNLEDYYRNAIDFILKKVDNPHFYIFSDEPLWVKENFVQNLNFTIIDCNNSANGYQDLRLMSHCNHNIIANSSFSWWGAWLNNNNEKIVIAPQKWFNISARDIKDLIPESWIII